MPRPRTAMRKIRDVLRLTYGDGLSRRQVAASTGIPVTTVSEHLGRAKAAGISWPLPNDMDDAALEAALVPTHGAVDRPAASAGLGSGPQRAQAQGRDPAAVLARVPRRASGGLRLQPVLQPLRRMAQEGRRRDAPAPPRRREDVRRLPRGHHPHLRPTQRHGRLRGAAARGLPGCLLLHLRRGPSLPGALALRDRPRPRTGVLRRRAGHLGAGQPALGGDEGPSL